MYNNWIYFVQVAFLSQLFSVCFCCFSEIMQAMVDSLTEPENVKMLKEIRDDCKNDALRVMVYVYPQVVSIKIKAVEKYGIHGAQGC